MSAIGSIAVRNTFVSLAAKRKREYRNVPRVGSRVRAFGLEHLVCIATIGVCLGSFLMFLPGGNTSVANASDPSTRDALRR
jgi:hypothetical protein